MARSGIAAHLARSVGLPESSVTTAVGCLDEGIRVARDTFAGVDLPSRVFVEELVARLGLEGASDDFEQVLGAVRVPELFLAIACARSDPKALEHFEAGYGVTIDAACRRFAHQIDLDDARQRVRERLLFSERPGIASYAGAGELAGWVRVSAVRFLINVCERETREQPAPEAFLDSIAADDASIDGILATEESRQAFKRAFTEAFDTLSNREKSLLRYAYADGLGVDRIGAVYRVHRATAARWIAAARDKLVALVVEGLVDRLDLSMADVPSVLRAALSQVPTTVMRHLRQ